MQRRLLFTIGYACDAEIQNLWMAILIDHDVGGLQIAVNDAALVGVMNRVADLSHELEAPCSGQPTGDGMLQE